MAAIHSHVRKKRAVIALAAILTLAGAGVAIAYWTSSGTGTGEATTGTGVAFEVSSAAAVGTITPGNAGQTIAFTVTNPSEGPQYLTEVTVALADADNVEWTPPAGCLIEDYVATISTAPVAGEIAAGASVTGEATVVLLNTELNQDACKEAVIPMYFEAF